MKKKDRKKLIEITDQKLAAAIGNDYKLRKNEGKSFSKTFSEFIYPLIQYDISEEAKTRSLLIWGQTVSNKAVAESFPNHKASINFEKIFHLFYFINKKAGNR